VQQQQRQRQRTGSLMEYLHSWEGTEVLPLRSWRMVQQGCSSIWQRRLLLRLVVAG
jgi:hypothetical protein